MSDSGVKLTASQTPAETAMPRGVRGIGAGLLRVPLIVKLIGANVLVAVAVSVAFGHWEGRDLLVLGGLTLAASLGLSTLLIRIALGPLDELEAAARRISAGAHDQRLDTSPVADARLAELRESFNGLLLQVELDRARIRQLARLSLEMREAECASLADTLREATSQELAALSMQLGVAAGQSLDPAAAASIQAARDIAARISEQIGAMADSVFPGLIGELGLPAALEALGRRVQERTGMAVSVDTSASQRDLPLALERVLFRVAEEAARNAEAHSQARSLRIELKTTGRVVELRVEDNGQGFDAATAEQESLGVGLFRSKELLAHIGGQLQVATAPGQGATISAIVPVPEKAP
jgi:signal transduction histidine kinase